jgi:ribonuclease III
MIQWIQHLISGNPEIKPGDLSSELSRLEDVIGVSISNHELFNQALKHRSLLRGTSDSHTESNERLEYLGDAVLGFVVAEHLYLHYPDDDEGFLTRLRAKLVNGKALAERARELGLGSFILVSDSLTEEQKDGDSILADAFEAIIGAIYLEHGTEAARSFVRRVALVDVDLDQLAHRKDNHKSILLEYVQAKSTQQPDYVVISESGPSHDKRFVVAVMVDGSEYGRAEDKSKKRAEQTAAKLAIRQLKENDLKVDELKSDELSTGFNQS